MAQQLVLAEEVHGIETLEEGMEYRKSFEYSQEHVQAYAELTGDYNPLHLDEEYAATTVFKRPIIHGILGVSIFSNVLGTEFPGEGTIYMNQSTQFLRPMYPDTVYEAVFEVVERNEARNTARIRTDIYDKEKNKVIIRGEATIMNKSKL